MRQLSFISPDYEKRRSRADLVPPVASGLAVLPQAKIGEASVQSLADNLPTTQLHFVHAARRALTNPIAQPVYQKDSQPGNRLERLFAPLHVHSNGRPFTSVVMDGTNWEGSCSRFTDSVNTIRHDRSSTWRRRSQRSLDLRPDRNAEQNGNSYYGPVLDIAGAHPLPRDLLVFLIQLAIYWLNQ